MNDTTLRLVQATLHKLRTFSRGAHVAGDDSPVWGVEDDAALRVVDDVMEGRHYA